MFRVEGLGFRIALSFLRALFQLLGSRRHSGASVTVGTQHLQKSNPV